MENGLRRCFFLMNGVIFLYTASKVSSGPIEGDAYEWGVLFTGPSSFVPPAAAQPRARLRIRSVADSVGGGYMSHRLSIELGKGSCISFFRLRRPLTSGEQQGEHKTSPR